MILVLAVDSHGGVSFNGRRQRESWHLRNDLLSCVASKKGSKLWMSNYSKSQFYDMKGKVGYERIPDIPEYVPKDYYIEQAGDKDYCFVELWNQEIWKCILQKNPKKIVIYNWQRNYPSDLYFDPELYTYGWKKESSYKIELGSKFIPPIVKTTWCRITENSIVDFKYCFGKASHGFTCAYESIEDFEDTDFSEKNFKIGESLQAEFPDDDHRRCVSTIKLKGTKKFKEADDPQGEFPSNGLDDDHHHCHIIGLQLRPYSSNTDWRPQNLKEREVVIGTSYLNTELMLSVENMVRDYLGETDDTILYRVTVEYRADQSLDAVRMEAQSLTNKENGLRLRVLCRNIHKEESLKRYALKKRFPEIDRAYIQREYRSTCKTNIFHAKGSKCIAENSESEAPFECDTFHNFWLRGKRPCVNCIINKN